MCPHCNKKITLDEALTHPIQEKIRKQFDEEFKEQQKQLDSQLKKVQSELDKKDTQLKNLKDSLQKQIDEAVRLKREEIEKETKKKVSEEIKLELKDLHEQIGEKDKLLEKAQREELKLRKQQRELEEKTKNFELEMERKLDGERKKIFEEVSKKITQEHELKDKEKQKQIYDLNREISEWKRKAEQSSQQLQGEVLELELESILKENFVYDIIEPISSGVRGADVLQKVCSKAGNICGSILLESKNAKDWRNSWLWKLKSDLREAKADVGVIVSTVLPNGINSFSYREGVFIADFRLIIPIMFLLRQQIIEVARAKSANMGRNEKIELLYQYLTGTQFRQKIESVVEPFAKMMDDLQKEKRSTTKNWAKREKQIEQGVLNLASMYGDMQGIIGSSLPDIKSLDMPKPLLQIESEEGTKEE